jgi:hypothetical protein
MNGGTMKLSSAAILVAALIILPLPVLAADNPLVRLDDPSQQASSADEVTEETPEDGDAEEEVITSMNPFLPGEQTIGISAGLQIPAFLLPKTGEGASNLKLGGSFGFSYQYFLYRGFALGGDLSASYNTTISGLSVFILPLGVTASYWWTKLPFEFQIFGEAGVYMMRENHQGIIDPMAKFGVGAYWRLSSGWAVGLRPTFWFIPELHYGEYKSLTQYGGFVDAALTAVYHM